MSHYCSNSTARSHLASLDRKRCALPPPTGRPRSLVQRPYQTYPSSRKCLPGGANKAPCIVSAARARGTGDSRARAYLVQAAAGQRVRIVSCTRKDHALGREAESINECRSDRAKRLIRWHRIVQLLVKPLSPAIIARGFISTPVRRRLSLSLSSSLATSDVLGIVSVVACNEAEDRGVPLAGVNVHEVHARAVRVVDRRVVAQEERCRERRHERDALASLVHVTLLAYHLCNLHGCGERAIVHVSCITRSSSEWRVRPTNEPVKRSYGRDPVTRATLSTPPHARASSSHNSVVEESIHIGEHCVANKASVWARAASQQPRHDDDDDDDGEQLLDGEHRGHCCSHCARPWLVSLWRAQNTEPCCWPPPAIATTRSNAKPSCFILVSATISAWATQPPNRHCVSRRQCCCLLSAACCGCHTKPTVIPSPTWRVVQ